MLEASLNVCFQAWVLRSSVSGQAFGRKLWDPST